MHIFLSVILTIMIQLKLKQEKISAIKSWFKYLHNTVELINKNPAEKLELPKLQKRNPVYLTLSESEKVINSIKEEKMNLIELEIYV